MSSFPRKMRFGIFLAPFHPVTENPSAALRRDFALVEWLDELGYDEAWIGEHHSAGMEIIASPEVFIAAAAERTRNIRLGTGVSSLPYHHPLMLADRMMQLDHQTRGRAMLGMGPGSLPSDAVMMGIDPLRQRDMMDEAMAAIVPLLRGETVTLKTSWFELRDAYLQLTPYSRPYLDMAAAATISPAGPRAAGKYGLGLLSIGATTRGGFNALAMTHQIWSEKAAEYGNTVDRASWRLVGPMHVAETRERARENVRFGIGEWLRYFQEVGALPLAPGGSVEDAIDSLTKSGLAVIGTPDDAIAQLQRLEEQSGGFGCFLQLAHNWADFENTKRSYELIARYVMPRFQELNPNRVKSMEWAAKNRPTLIGAVTQAIGNEMQKHVKEQAARKAAKKD
jgi:limonene 1,2-monooxygenase